MEPFASYINTFDDATCIEIDFKPSFDRFAKRIRLEMLPDLEKEGKEFFSLVKNTLQPKCVYKTSYIESFDQEETPVSIKLEGLIFQGKVLEALEGTNRVFPYILTCGNEMEEVDISQFDYMMAPYWLEELKMQALGRIRKTFFDHIRENFRLSNVTSVKPGSGNADGLPVHELEKLLSILNSGCDIGVTLTDSYLMMPNKTIAGIGFSPKLDYENCTC